MPTVKSYQDLIVWQKAYALVLEVYVVTRDWPVEERYVLTQQVRRAALSIACNIAEGWGRGTRADYKRFVQMSRGSTYELQTQMWIARDLGYLAAEHTIFALIEEVDRLTNGLLRAL